MAVVWKKLDQPPVMPFGAHRDRSFSEIESTYLIWTLRGITNPREGMVDLRLYSLQALIHRDYLHYKKATTSAGVEVLKVRGKRNPVWVDLPIEWAETILLAYQNKAFYAPAEVTSVPVPEQPVDAAPQPGDPSVLDVRFTPSARAEMEQLMPMDMAVLKNAGHVDPHKVIFREAMEQGTREGSELVYAGLKWKFVFAPDQFGGTLVKVNEVSRV